ncbi:MAG TPA: porphobilinogen synthase, partial [Myxococcaceae bacterium]|nr:porphobilinogen synthase [Myxococcaceae bacterium]
MAFPIHRPRRLRRTEALRRMVRETELRPSDLIYPLFVVEGRGVRKPVPSMPGIDNLSVDLAVEEAKRARAVGVPAVILFGIPGHKDPRGTGAWAEDGIVQRALRAMKEAVPELQLLADICLCEYTDHGHCGVIHGAEVDNDQSLPLLAQMAVSCARAGADIVAPSDMMDGRVAAIRTALDGAGLSSTPILSYAAKYASGFYGPFREA